MSVPTDTLLDTLKILPPMSDPGFPLGLAVILCAGLAIAYFITKPRTAKDDGKS